MGSSALASRRAARRPRFEPLEARFLLSAAGDDPPWLASDPAPLLDPAAFASAEAPQPGVFYGDSRSQTATFTFSFEGTPQLREVDGGVVVTLDGEETWVSTGDPVVPVRRSSVLLPPGMAMTSVEARYGDPGARIAASVPLLAAPMALPSGGFEGASNETATIVTSSFGDAKSVGYETYTVAGYQVGSLRVFPVEYDAATDALLYHREISLQVTVEAVGGATLPVRDVAADRLRVAQLVDNPGALADYAVATESPGQTGAALPADGPCEYVIVTSSALRDGFLPLIEQKRSRGLTAEIVTVEYIGAHYSGTEVFDLADKIRHFLADAYTHWNTQWVLLGGDVEIVPKRGVYTSVGSTVDNSLPTDLYYACLDGPWNGDGDHLWGEPNDGRGGGDVDLVADVYVGRAPVSNMAETVNFVSKTVRYETTAHANATTAVWLGEQLDANTWGSYSSEPIRQQTVPDDWNVIRRYDSAGGWSGTDLRNDLNAGPHLVNHLGHSNETYNARLTNSSVAALTNADPYFMYSQGCMAGSFDTHDVAIGEQHVVGAHGAFGVVMNSRYGWYIPGSTPGASHYYALEFWDAVFNEGIVRLGEANQDSRDDNLFRVGATGVYRWIHFETNLFGDPETPIQTDGVPALPGGEIRGTLWHDVNGDGQRQVDEGPLAGRTVFLDLNGNGTFDSGTLIAASNEPVPIADNATVTSSIALVEGATIRDVNVTLDITHTYDADLEVCLISPAGTRVELFTRVGGWGRNFTNTTLDDEALVSIADAQAPFTGTFRPEGRLSRLDGESAVGTWTLEITDTMSWDTGTLNGWSLEIRHEEPHTQTGSDGAYVFTGLAEGAYRVGHPLSEDWRHTDPIDGVRLVSVGQGERVEGVDFGATQAIVPPPQAVDLGPIEFLEIGDLTGFAGDGWFLCRASRRGYLTIEAYARQPGSNLDLQMYDTRLSPLAASTAAGGMERIDWLAEPGESYYFRVGGDVAGAALRLANLVDLEGSQLVVYGTEGDDRFEFSARENRVSVNGVEYALAADAVTSFAFDGGAGHDTAVLEGSAGDDKAVLHPGRAMLAGPGYRVVAVDVHDVAVFGGGGNDVACLYDSAGDDLLVASPTGARMAGNGYSNQVTAFPSIFAFADEGGNDTARLVGSPGDDVFAALPGYAKLYGPAFCIRAFFPTVHAHGAGGADVAWFCDSPGNDAFVASPTQAALSGEGFYNRAVAFSHVRAIASAGNDVARLFGSDGDDTFVAAPIYAQLFGDGFGYRVDGFQAVWAYAGAGGTDVARLYDSRGDDTFVGGPTCARLFGGGFDNRAHGFQKVEARMGSGAYDRAYLFDSRGDDRLEASGRSVILENEDLALAVYGMAWCRATSDQGGRDTMRVEAVDFLFQNLGAWAPV